ncbi:MAG: DUF3987 domain-containing protein [Ruminococcus sp.]
MISISWGEPRPFRQRTDALPFPLDTLPPVLRDMAGAISVTTSTDVGMAGTAICNRVIRGRTEIPRPYLSVAIAGQPYIWDNMTNDTAFRSSGMLARFIHCFAKSDVGHRRYDTAAIPKEVKEKYHSLIHQFLKGKKDHDGKEVILHLSHKASDEYITYCNNYIEQDIKQSMCCCQDWGGKFHGLILRIACILHCVDCCSRGVEPSEESVNHDTLLRAFSLAHYYRYQAIHAFSINAPDGNIVKAEKIIQMFKTKDHSAEADKRYENV